MGFGFALVAPAKLGILHGECEPERDMHHGMTVFSSSLQQQHGVLTAGRQAICQGAAGGSRTDNDVIVMSEHVFIPL